MSQEQGPGTTGNGPPKLHRSKRTRNRRNWNPERIWPFVWNGLTLLLLLAAGAILLSDPRWQLLGALLLVAGLMAAALRLHYHILYNRRWWLSVCPRCQADALRRLRRSWWQRLLGWAGIPARPYICGACGWRGNRVDQTKIL